MAARLTVALCLSFLFYLQPGAAVGQDKDKEAPIGIDGFIDILRSGGHDKEELIKMVARRGVREPLTGTDEKNIRLAGKRLGEKGLDALVKALRANFLYANVKEPLVLRLGAPTRLEHLDFEATFTGRRGDDYVVEVMYPGAVEKAVETTHTDCEYTYEWGLVKPKRKFRLHIDSATPQEVQAVLLREVKKASTAPPEVIREYRVPCSPLQMQMVRHNYTDSPSLEVYYISEPITVGVLRHLARNVRISSIRTPIPESAKDSDPITAVYYEDAKDIATMLGTRLPTLHQLVNALNGQLMTLSPQAELVEDEDKSLIVVRQATGQNPSNTPLSSQVFANKVPRSDLAKGLLRVVRLPRGDNTFVTPNDPNRPQGP
jgi:hypothetical protein